jgi:threonine dehydrogenase-like Zn-dependent dehydrogenase
METALCDNTNPEGAEKMKKIYGQPAAGLFGYSHLYGGYPGGQAEYVRVPCADFGAFKIPDELSDEQVLFLTDTFRLASWPPRTAALSPGKQSLSGAVARSDSSPFAAPFCWAQAV